MQTTCIGVAVNFSLKTAVPEQQDYTGPARKVVGSCKLACHTRSTQ